MPPRVMGAQQAGTGFNAWWSSIPPITRFLATGMFATTALFWLGLLNPMTLALHWPSILKKLEVWRLFTNFFFLGKFSMSFAIKLLYTFTYGGKLESTTYQFDPAGFLFMLLFGAIACIPISLVTNMYFYSHSLVFMLIYVWSRNFPEDRVSIWGLVTVQSFYVPFAFIALTVLLGNDPIPDIIGVVIGHLYFFLKVLYPATSGRELLATPRFLRNWLAGRGLGVPHTTHAATAQPTFQAFRGQGRRIGTD